MPKSKLEKQKEAEQRALERSKRSSKDQISRLDSIFGVGLGAAKERARLLNQGKPKAEVAEEPRPKKNRKKKSDSGSDEVS